MKISAENNFGNSSKADLKFFVPLAVMQMQNSKSAKFFRGGNSKFALARFCVLSPSRHVQNFRPIGAEMRFQTGWMNLITRQTIRNIHCVSKKIPDVFSYNSRTHCRIFIIFGRNIIEKVGNQKVLYFPTSPHKRFCSALRNWKHGNLSFSRRPERFMVICP